ncbi:hypothetical protein [Allorhizocola rhizosphaerae]|nr:hypothetical protein [Allorhizocola rhizosphaerae]
MPTSPAGLRPGVSPLRLSAMKVQRERDCSRSAWELYGGNACERA